MSYKRILVQSLPEMPDWLAVQDRLGRAAHRVDHAVRVPARDGQRAVHAGDRVYIWRSGPQAGIIGIGSCLPSLVVTSAAHAVGPAADRKSTRLNSSH